MEIIGIDISKGWFDCFNHQQADRRRFANTPEGWDCFGRWAPERSRVIMEASGPYYLGLASWLHEQGIPVSVVNPLVIRRYGQMKLSRANTDAKDAERIAAYGLDQHPGLWSPPSQIYQQLRQLMSLREGLQQLATTHYPELMQALQTIPGIGAKTAILLIVLTDGFTRFSTARQLASYVGLCPRVWQSGSSIMGRGSICKLGCSQLRKLLYMCSWSAKRCNPGCRQLHERLPEKGKPERVIKVAIAHKLLRQAVAVGTKKESFDEKLAVAA